ncbi:peptidase 1 [Auricularia subglabra TFB-10046 SS5]|nr:peptidase 1 [Auricularia subglabra TFB-10046 SS5]
MRLVLSVAIAAALAAASSGTPVVPLLAVQKFAGPTKNSSFIVTLKAGVSKDAHFQQNPDIAAAVTHSDFAAGLLNGFAGTFDQAQVDALRASADVFSISENGIMKAMASSAVTTETNAPWGIARISQQAPLSGSASALNFTYHFDSTGGGGVDIFIVDTGINTAHTEFGGRASFGAAIDGLPRTDDNGHGTHVAGTAIGARFGVAKAANAIGVKVLDRNGQGTLADIISGLSFVFNTARSSGRPSVASLSFGGAPSSDLDNAVATMTNSGIHVIVAAGNDNENAANNSPARAPSAITVGSTTISDTRASFSNFGSAVDIFAPGQTITSAFAGSNTATSVLSGTSMSAAHVAGLVAYFIGLNGNVSPATMSANIRSLGLTGLIGGIPSGTSNDLAYNGM